MDTFGVGVGVGVGAGVGVTVTVFFTEKYTLCGEPLGEVVRREVPWKALMTSVSVLPNSQFPACILACAYSRDTP